MITNIIVPLERQRKVVASTTSIASRTSGVKSKGACKPSSVATHRKPVISVFPASSSASKKRPRTSLTASTDAINKSTIEILKKIHPSEYARAAFKANGFGDLEAIAKDSESRFLPPTAAMLEAYNTSIVQEVRDNNLEAVKQLYNDGYFQYGCNACNRFGESILHIACRRGHLEMVKFLIGEAGLSCCTIRDDYHRTPLHDAFWTSSASPDVIDYLLEQPFVTELLMAKDKRGFTPLDYSRGEDRGKWLRFLWERRGRLKPASMTRGSLSDLIEHVDSIPKDNSSLEPCPAPKRRRIVG